MNAHLKLSGKVHTLGICFFPEGFYPFVNIPVSEFKNQLLGGFESGLNWTKSMSERLKETTEVRARLDIIEKELVLILIHNNDSPERFQKIFKALKQNENSQQITVFCRQNNVCIRNLERMYNKYVGGTGKYIWYTKSFPFQFEPAPIQRFLKTIRSGL